MTISPSIYFTSGQTSNSETNFSASTYLSISRYPKYLFFGYENYREIAYQQNLFILGYTQPVVNKLWLRSVGFYYQTSTDNISVSLANRILYGINPVFSFGYAYSIYSKTINNTEKLYNVHQLNPEYQRSFYQTNINIGFIYTNANNETYFAGSIKISKNITNPLYLEIAGIYGELFHHIDDRLLVVNNRNDIQTAKLSIKASYQLPVKGFNITGIITQNRFDNYYINYYTAGLDYTGQF